MSKRRTYTLSDVPQVKQTAVSEAESINNAGKWLAGYAEGYAERVKTANAAIATEVLEPQTIELLQRAIRALNEIVYK